MSDTFLKSCTRLFTCQWIKSYSLVFAAVGWCRTAGHGLQSGSSAAPPEKPFGHGYTVWDEDTNETIRHNYRYGAFAVNPFAFTTRHKVAAECSALCRITVILWKLWPALMRVFRKWGAPAVFARSSYNLKEETIQYLKAIYFSVKTVLIMGGYRLPPTGYKNNLQNNVNLLILELRIF